jgi:hypothetical protein
LAQAAQKQLGSFIQQSQLVLTVLILFSLALQQPAVVAVVLLVVAVLDIHTVLLVVRAAVVLTTATVLAEQLLHQVKEMSVVTLMALHLITHQVQAAVQAQQVQSQPVVQ